MPPAFAPDNSTFEPFRFVLSTYDHPSRFLPGKDHMEPAFSSKTIIASLEFWAAKQPDRTIYRFLPNGEDEPEVVTYAQLLRRAHAIAGSLQRWRGERALMLFHSGREFLEAFLACLYAGVIAVPAYPPRKNHNFERLQAVVKDCAPALILTTDNIRQFAEPMFTVAANASGQWMPRNIEWISTERIDDADTFDGNLPDAGQIAFLQYTSGSTGNPKGVMISHENLIHNERAIHSVLQTSAEHHVVSWLPLFHDMGLIGSALYTLYRGIDALLMPPAAFLQKPYCWLQAISDMSKQGPVGTVAPNFAWQLCVDQIKDEQVATLDLSTLDYALTGAEPIRKSTLDAFARRFAAAGFKSDAFRPCYGLAEATLVISCAGTGNAVVCNADSNALARNLVKPAVAGITLVSSGKSLLDQDFIIVDPSTLAAAEDGAIGEIWVSGKHVAKGYWNNPELSAATFNGFTQDGQGPYLRTGDLGSCIDGDLYVTGRLKDLVIIRGRNLYPQDIEFATESAHRALRRNGSAAFAIEHDGEEKIVIVAEIERAQRMRLDADVVFTAIRKAIVDKFSVAVHAIALLKPGSLLKTSSGKVQRGANRQLFLAQECDALALWKEAPAEFDADSTDFFERAGDFSAQTEQQFQHWISLWVAKCVGCDVADIDTDAPVISFGIDSIDAVRLVAALETWARHFISADVLLERNTIAELANYLHNADLGPTQTSATSTEVIEGTI